MDHSRTLYARWKVRRETPVFDEATQARVYRFTKIRQLRLMRISAENADVINAGKRENEKLIEFEYLVPAGDNSVVPEWSIKKVS